MHRSSLHTDRVDSCSMLLHVMCIHFAVSVLERSGRDCVVDANALQGNSNSMAGTASQADGRLDPRNMLLVRDSAVSWRVCCKLVKPAGINAADERQSPLSKCCS